VASSLHSRLPRIQHAYVWPFFFLYPAWSFVYFFHYDDWIKSEEITFVTLGLLLTINSLLFLTCQWSVSIKASLTCRKVRGCCDLMFSLLAHYSLFVSHSDHQILP